MCPHNYVLHLCVCACFFCSCYLHCNFCIAFFCICFFSFCVLLPWLNFALYVFAFLGLGLATTGQLQKPCKPGNHGLPKCKNTCKPGNGGWPKCNEKASLETEAGQNATHATQRQKMHKQPQRAAKPMQQKCKCSRKRPLFQRSSHFGKHHKFLHFCICFAFWPASVSRLAFFPFWPAAVSWLAFAFAFGRSSPSPAPKLQKHATRNSATAATHKISNSKMQKTRQHKKLKLKTADAKNATTGRAHGGGKLFGMVQAWPPKILLTVGQSAKPSSLVHSLSLSLSLALFIYPSLCLSVYLSIHLSILLFIHLSIYVSMPLFIY